MTTTMNLGVHRISADPTWRTPGRVFADLDAEFDFTLDPAASAPIKPGIRWFGEAEQGLWQEWSGRVFVNPPYGRAIVDWMAKISLERSRCEVIVALVPARTDTEWWHEHAMLADEIRFIRGRLSFEGVDAPKGHNAPFPSVVLIYRGGSTGGRTMTDSELAALRWWTLADVLHDRNEEVADIGGHCNHDQSPPECVADAQRTAADYNSRVVSPAQKPTA